MLTVAAHRSAVLALVFSPDGQLVASGSGDGTVWPVINEERPGAGADASVRLWRWPGLEPVAVLPGLRLRGLMAIPEPSDDVRLQRSRFALLHDLLDRLGAESPGLDTLSMGMSHDLEAAILEGATIVRIGTAFFGERETTT